MNAAPRWFRFPAANRCCIRRSTEIVAGLVARKKYIYLCTNALKLEERLPQFKPSKYLSFSIHLDGPREEHDAAVCREGVYDAAVRGDQNGRGRRLSRDDQHHVVRSRRPGEIPPVLR